MIRKGRFNKPAAVIAQLYGESISFDWRLYRHDIAGSIAHAAALARAAIITADEHEQIENGLRAIEKEIESGKFEWDHPLEDIHMNIEAALTKESARQARSCTPHGAGTIKLRSFDGDAAKILDVVSALSKRRAIGAPSPENIASQIALWHSRLGSHK
jgi:argininosuccinate lyase